MKHTRQIALTKNINMYDRTAPITNGSVYRDPIAPMAVVTA